MQNPTPDQHDTKFRIASWTAGVAGVLAIVIIALMAYDYSRRTAKDPLESDVYRNFRSALSQQPTNEELKKLIRANDLELRQEFFRHKAFADVGAILLLASLVVFIIASKTAVTLHRRLPNPRPLVTLEDTESKWKNTALWGVAGLMICLAAGALLLNFTSRSSLSNYEETAAASGGNTKKSGSDIPPVETTKIQESPSRGIENGIGNKNVPAVPSASDEEIAKAWPSFRGPGGRNISAFENIPIEWNATAEKEKNIRWKTAVPLPGNSSPILWKDRVFLSGADEKRREVYCFDAKSGKLLWQKPLPAGPASNAKFSRPPDAGYAAPTMATDGSRVFTIFANGDLAGFDFEGNLAWSKNLGMPESQYGFASSPTMCKNRLIVQFDQGSEKNPKSKLYAFDSATGEIVWQIDRKVPNSWASPIVIRVGDREEIVTAANPWVIAYDAADGKEIWRAKCLHGDVGASPTFSTGHVFTANDSDALSAIPADGQGDVTSKIRWKGEDGMPDTCSPLANGQYVLLWDAGSTLTCYDEATGDKLWEESFDEPGSSSPSFMGKRIFLFAKSGKAWVVEPEKEKCNHLAENELGEECVTSPAFQNGCFYIRGKDHLFCIGE